MPTKPLITIVPVMLALAGCSTHLLQPRKAERQTGHCAEGVCLLYLQNVLDSDGDGYSDADEIAMGTDPKDAASYPKTLDVVARLQERDLRSFNLGLSQILVLPEKDPEGKDLVPSRAAVERKSTFEALGISAEKLKTYGASFTDGFALTINATGELQRPANGQSSGPPELRLVMIRQGLYSADAFVDDGPKTTISPDGTKVEKGKFSDSKKQDADKPGVEVKERDITITYPDGKPERYTERVWVEGGNITGRIITPKKYCSDDPCGRITVGTVSKEDKKKVDAKLAGTVRPVPDQPPSPVRDGSPIVTLEKKRNTIILTDPDKADYPFRYKSLFLVNETTFFDRKSTNTTPGPEGIVGDIRPGSGRP
jgi:hypothetical protein